jgi:hypothetical protein
VYVCYRVGKEDETFKSVDLQLRERNTDADWKAINEDIENTRLRTERFNRLGKKWEEQRKKKTELKSIFVMF